MMNVFVGLILFCVLACQNRQEIKTVSNNLATIQEVDTAITPQDSFSLEEFFIDSTTIGRKTLNKVEVLKYTTIDSNYVHVKFYSKELNHWKLKQTIEFEKDGFSSCQPEISDFNNDQLNDLTIISSIAARGANEIRRLFLYDNTRDKLIEMKNSEDYPNMLYNKELNCIDAFLVYGGSSTVFLRISGDSLKEFASVEAMDGITVSEIDGQGNEKIIFQDTANKQGFIRFKTYKPLREYEEY